MKNIAILFDDVTEFNFIRKGIDDLLPRKDLQIDLIVPANSGYNGLADYTKKYIRSVGYNVRLKPRKIKYDILLEPYNIAKFIDIDYEYRIKYRYSLLIGNKPYIYEPDWNIHYDAILSSSKMEEDGLRVYSKLEYVKPTNFQGLKKPKKAKKEKPILLIAPSFGRYCCIDYLDDKTIRELKETFHVIAKSHHATQFRKSETQRYRKLTEIADEFYDQNKPIAELMLIADIVLSDVSGAIFDAIYAEIPVVLCHENIADYDHNGIESIQKTLIQQKLLNNIYGQKKIAEKLQKEISENKVKETKRMLFGDVNSFDSFADIINKYLDKDPQKDINHLVHKFKVKRYYNLEKDVEWFKGQVQHADININEMEKRIAKLENNVRQMETSASWRLTKPLRLIIYKLRK